MAGEAAEVRRARDQAEKTHVTEHDWPRDSKFGMPMIKISVAASELIPTRQYASVTVGPVVVTRFVIDTSNDEDLAKEISNTISLCEGSVAEARESVHALIRQSTDGR